MLCMCFYILASPYGDSDWHLISDISYFTVPSRLWYKHVGNKVDLRRGESHSPMWYLCQTRCKPCSLVPQRPYAIGLEFNVVEFADCIIASYDDLKIVHFVEYWVIGDVLPDELATWMIDQLWRYWSLKFCGQLLFQHLKFKFFERKVEHFFGKYLKLCVIKCQSCRVISCW